MSQQIQEQLSAFMDGELSKDETRFLLKRTEGDTVLVQRWTRYHVVRQALRRQEIVALRADFSRSLMARLDAETVPQSNRTTWLRWGSGGAIAAAVAVTALMVTKPVSETTTPASVAASNPAAARQVPVAPVSTTQLASSPKTELQTPFLTPLVPNSPIPTATASFGTDTVEPATFDPRMQSYVIRHYQATGSTGQPDFVPYILLTQPAQTPEPRQAENR
jgi:sigma-E factor negative regulatory protein RseA